MAEITKKVIKEAVLEALAPFAESVQTDFKQVNGRLEKMEGRLGGVERRLDRVEGQLEGVEARLGNVEADVQWMKTNMHELFTKLDEFITMYRKQEEELLSLGAQLRRLEERVAKLEGKGRKR